MGEGAEGRNPGPAGIRDCMQYQEGTGELLCWVRSKQAERGGSGYICAQGRGEALGAKVGPFFYSLPPQSGPIHTPKDLGEGGGAGRGQGSGQSYGAPAATKNTKPFPHPQGCASNLTCPHHRPGGRPRRARSCPP